jgi:hypothetical protein
MSTDPGPKRIAEGVVRRVGGPLFMLKEGGEEPGRLIACDLLDGWLDGKRVRITAEVIDADAKGPPEEIDIDGVVDEKRNVRYVGKATRQPNGNYLALASVDGCLCRVECSIAPSADTVTVPLREEQPHPLELPEESHVDTFIERFNSDAYASFVLHLFRLPATLQMKFAFAIERMPLFCTYGGERYRVTGASRFGDVWLAKDFTRDHGYDHRVNVVECSAWGATAGAKP